MNTYNINSYIYVFMHLIPYLKGKGATPTPENKQS